MITVVHPGTINRDSGPDFSAAKVRIGNTLLVGNVELHIRTSDWLRHGHENDRAFNKLILHVVLEHDTDQLPNKVPVLQLKEHIPDYVIAQYSSLLHTVAPLPCAHQLKKIPSIIIESWLNRMLAERWETKMKSWQDDVDHAKGDWRTLLYQRLAAGFGFKVNSIPFQLLAKSLPLNILGKHQNNLFQLESLLYGQAGMLEQRFYDDYPHAMKEEYFHLKQKYGLRPIEAHLWKFMRMRPANFPTIRIAQFAALIHKSADVFSLLTTMSHMETIISLLSVTASEYWNTHYRFDTEPLKSSLKNLGDTAAQNLIINAIAPVQFLYSGAQGNLSQQERAVELLHSVPAEENKILSVWKDAGLVAEHAGHSQAQLELFQNYCQQKRCLECALGLQLIRRPVE